MTDDLLVKFLLGETTSDENQQVNAWLAADPAHRKQFADMELIWKTSKNLESESKLDENAAWDRFKKRVDQQLAKPLVPVVEMEPSRNFSWLKFAATVVLLLASALLLFRQSETNVMANNHVVTETLPDGSEVTLNKNSSITYTNSLLSKRRRVNLSKGEVFFKVEPDKSKPFVITAHNVEVEVVGTSFNVKHNDKSTEVIVETGIVKVMEGSETVTLRAGEKVMISGDKQLKAEPNTDHLYNYYRSKTFVADNTPLWRVVEVLNEAYSVNIVIENNEVKNLPLTTTFKDESLNQILKVIAETFKLSITPKGDKIILK